MSASNDTDTMKLANKNILITGGAGFIGSHLARRLARETFVRIVDNFSTGSWDNIAELADRDNVDIIEGDVRNRPALQTWCNRIDVVFHLAVSCLRTSLGDPHASHHTNAGGTLNVCQAAMDCGVRDVVYVSSSEVYGTARCVPMAETHPLEPITVYGASKLAGELYVKAFHRTYGLPVKIVRPFNTYGPRAPWRGRRAEAIPRFILRAREGGGALIFGDGTQTRDFMFVDDTATGILLAAECDALGGDVVNIAAGVEVSIRDMAAMIGEIVGSAAPPTFVEPRPGDVVRHHADIGKAEQLLGFVPQTDIRDGLRRTVAWFNAAVPREEAVAAAAVNW